MGFPFPWKAHVRSFTKNKDSGVKASHAGTFLGFIVTWLWCYNSTIENKDVFALTCDANWLERSQGLKDWDLWTCFAMFCWPRKRFHIFSIWASIVWHWELSESRGDSKIKRRDFPNGGHSCFVGVVVWRRILFSRTCHRNFWNGNSHLKAPCTIFSSEFSVIWSQADEIYVLVLYPDAHQQASVRSGCLRCGVVANLWVWWVASAVDTSPDRGTSLSILGLPDLLLDFETWPGKMTKRRPLAVWKRIPEKSGKSWNKGSQAGFEVEDKYRYTKTILQLWHLASTLDSTFLCSQFSCGETCCRIRPSQTHAQNAVTKSEYFPTCRLSDKQ